ncbi:MAG: hypothetical protein D6815_12415 [Candidatus Dadabacteria bacterium]|nr:MAG: hypothetical protein D6815_12415 [Candidatus Dadabacteria bacterium]
MWKLFRCAAAAGVIAAASLVGVRAVWAQGCDVEATGVCMETAIAASKACRAEMRDDFWLAVGLCKNLSSVEPVRRCRRRARQERRDGFEECVAQCTARQDVCRVLGPAPYHPSIDPTNFVDPATVAANPNPYFPLVPGTTWQYSDGEETTTVTVTARTKTILGVACLVVRDVVEVGGETIEDTEDWYAQDGAGNVWYFGEIAQGFEDGDLVTLEGSWKAGVNGAEPGIIMEANPAVGDFYRQEFLLGDAEDVAEVLSVTGEETVPAASCQGQCVVTKDTSPLEPDVVEHKYYAPGIGVILEKDPTTGARNELVAFTAP